MLSSCFWLTCRFYSHFVDSAPEETYIYAEELYFVSGQQFLLPGKSLSISNTQISLLYLRNWSAPTSFIIVLLICEVLLHYKTREVIFTH